MSEAIFCTVGHSGAMPFAHKILTEHGFFLTNRKDPDVTHLLLPVPSFEKDGRIKGGGVLEHILADLPDNITIIGGNLAHPALMGYRKIDLLEDPAYLIQNSAITADCAIQVIKNHLSVEFDDCVAMIIGWGRIGKCLSTQLKTLGCQVTVAARKESDRQALQTLGFTGISIEEIPVHLQEAHLVINTVPATILDTNQCSCHRGDTIFIELASLPGIVGTDVIQALGLPGKYAPEASGNLIAQTILRHIKEVHP